MDNPLQPRVIKESLQRLFPPGANDSLVLSYLSLRKIVGIIGIGLPLVLVVGKFFVDGAGIEDSISDYFYTTMRGVFIGSLCAMGMFFLSYRGYERRDDFAGDLAFVFAVVVALFPTTPNEPTRTQQFIGTVHLISAAGLFLTLAFFSLALFRKTAGALTEKKLVRNRVYSLCGWAILVCIGLIATIIIISKVSSERPFDRLDPIFWLEAAAIWAFGWSWFTKGEGLAILNDTEEA